MRTRQQRETRARGSAVIALIVILCIMALYLVGNSLTLHQLKQEMRMIEKRQAKKFETGTTNAPAPTTRTNLPPRNLD